jgi:Tol biopolymer transport system component
LAFTSNRSGNLEIWAVSTRTGALRRLTDHPADDWDPAFIGGGKKLLWSSNRGGHFEVWIAEADGSRPRQVSQDGADAENPTATPDGRWIVYNSGHPEKRGVWKMRADGSEAKQLVRGTTAWPEVSPDGRHALYTVQQRGRTVVRVVRLDDGQVLPFEITVKSGRGRARWMPGGRAVGYVDEDEQGRIGVFAQDFHPGRDTVQTRRPLSGLSYDIEAESFAFSPDGSKMVVAMLEFSSNLLIAEGVPGVEPVRRKK